MTDSLIDEAVACCRDVIQELDDGPMRRVLKLRLELLEGAAWSIALEPAVLRLVEMLDTKRARYFASQTTHLPVVAHLSFASLNAPT